MGFRAALVLHVNRRGALAVVAIAVSVAYSLMAGAASTGLQQAQTALAEDVQSTYWIVERPDGSSFDLAALPLEPETALASLVVEDRTLYTVRRGAGGESNASGISAGPAAGLTDGRRLVIAGRSLQVDATEPPRGARSDWLGVSPSTFLNLGGPGEPTVHVAVYSSLPGAGKRALTASGFAVVEAPAALPFYVGGARQLASVVELSVLASAAVVSLIAWSFAAMEERARRPSLATLNLFGGPGLVRRLLFARGLLLIGAGTVLGALASGGLLFLLRRGGMTQLGLEGPFLVMALSFIVGGGLLGLGPGVWAASRRLEAADLVGRPPRPGSPRLFRLTFVSWRAVVPLAAASIVLTMSLGAVFGAVEMPQRVFGLGETATLASETGNPLRGHVSAFLGEHLGRVEGFEGASPEIFAPTVLLGRPVMVRGAVWDLLSGIEPVAMKEGRPPSAAGEVVLGSRLARALDVASGHALLAPAAYRAATVPLRVVGVFESPGILGDEAVVSLATGRAFTGQPAETVNMIRYRWHPPEPSQAGLRPPIPTGIAVVGLRVVPERPVALEDVEAEVELVNFSPLNATRQLTLRVDGRAAADRWVSLAGHSSGRVSLSFRAPLSSGFTLQVNPSVEGRTTASAYSIEAPGVAARGQNLTLVVRDRAGVAARDVRVLLDGESSMTDSEGRARLVPPEAGNRSLVAEGPEGRAARLLLVVSPEDVARSRIEYRAVEGPTELVPGTWSGTVLVENVGGIPFEGPLPFPVDGKTVNVTAVGLLPGVVSRVDVSVPLEAGIHRLGPPARELVVRVAAAGTDPGGGGASAPKSLEELLDARRMRAIDAGATAMDPLTAFLAQTYRNLNAALTIVTLATVLHAGLIAFVAVSREVEERARTIGILTSVGAGATEVRRRGLLEFAWLGAVASVAGILVGFGLLGLAGAAGLLSGFGHQLLPATGVGFGIRLVLVSVATTLACALVAIESQRGRGWSHLVTSGPRRASRPPLDQLLGGGA